MIREMKWRMLESWSTTMQSGVRAGASGRVVASVTIASSVAFC